MFIFPFMHHKCQFHWKKPRHSWQVISAAPHDYAATYLSRVTGVCNFGWDAFVLDCAERYYPLHVKPWTYTEYVAALKTAAMLSFSNRVSRAQLLCESELMAFWAVKTSHCGVSVPPQLVKCQLYLVIKERRFTPASIPRTRTRTDPVV